MFNIPDFKKALKKWLEDEYDVYCDKPIHQHERCRECGGADFYSFLLKEIEDIRVNGNNKAKKSI